MGNIDLAYVNRRSILNNGEGIRCDDFKDMYSNGLYPSKVDKHNVSLKSIQEEGRKNSLRMEIYYDGFEERFVIFGINAHGFRFHFLTLEDYKNGFLPLDTNAVNRVREIFFYNRNPKRFRREFKEKKQMAVLSKNRERFEELKYHGGQYRRTIQKMNRIAGNSIGKSNLPFGRPSSNRRW